MSDPSFTTGECAECGQPPSLEVGITNYGSEGGSKLYCTPCAPNSGRGYTLADLERWREESRTERPVADLKRKQQVMDLLGPDAYFAAFREL